MGLPTLGLQSLWTRLKSGLAGNSIFPDSSWFGSWLNARGALSSGGTRSTNSAPVTAGDALSLTACYRACSLLSDLPASLPISVLERPSSGGAKLVSSTDASRALATMSHVDKEMAFFSTALFGNGFVEIQRNSRGGPTALVAIPSWRVYLAQDQQRRLFYVIQPDDSIGEPEQRVLPESDIVHLRFRVNGRNRFMGVPPLASVNPALDAVLSSRELQQALFQNSSVASMVLQTDKPLPPNVVDLIKQSWREVTTGPNAGSTPVLTHGLKPLPMPKSWTAIEADLIASLRFGVAEVSRAYGIPLSLLSEVAHASYASAVEESRAFTYSTLAPWCARISDAFSQKLLSPEQRARGISVEIDLTELRLGDGQSKADYVKTMIAAGAMSLNEGRNLCGLPDLPGADTLALPLNSRPLQTWLTAPATKTSAPEAMVREFRSKMLGTLHSLQDALEQDAQAALQDDDE